jgi:hypothetical protein
VRGPAASDRKIEEGKTGLRGELGRSGRKGRELGRRPSLFAGWKTRERWREGFGFDFFNSFSFKTFQHLKLPNIFQLFKIFSKFQTNFKTFKTSHKQHKPCTSKYDAQALVASKIIQNDI